MSQQSLDPAPEGTEGAPPPLQVGDVVRRVVKLLAFALAAAVVVTAIWLISGSVGSAIPRAVIGLVLAGVVASIGVSYFRQVGNPPPPDPVPTDVHPGLRLAYVCEMCGLELAVLKVAKDRAPKHCGEAMVLVRRPAAERPE